MGKIEGEPQASIILDPVPRHESIDPGGVPASHRPTAAAAGSAEGHARHPAPKIHETGLSVPGFELNFSPKAAPYPAMQTTPKGSTAARAFTPPLPLATSALKRRGFVLPNIRHRTKIRRQDTMLCSSCVTALVQGGAGGMCFLKQLRHLRNLCSHPQHYFCHHTSA